MRCILVLAVVCAIASADTLRLRSGRNIEGTYLGGDARNIRFDNGDRVQSYSINDVEEIHFGSGSSTSNSTSSSSSSASVDSDSRPLSPSTSASTNSTRSNSGLQSRSSDTTRSAGEIPEGTGIVIRLIDDVDSQRDSTGQTYKASVDEPVVVGERTLIPRGADVIMKLVEDKQSGKLSGKTELTMDLVSIQVNGQMIDVNTDEVTRSSGSRTSKSTKVVGGTAALGAIIGAIAGGGKGAAIGALSGAAAGGAVQVITKGERVKIPSESRLTFTLQQPIRL